MGEPYKTSGLAVAEQWLLDEAAGKICDPGVVGAPCQYGGYLFSYLGSPVVGVGYLVFKPVDGEWKRIGRIAFRTAQGVIDWIDAQNASKAKQQAQDAALTKDANEEMGFLPPRTAMVPLRWAMDLDSLMRQYNVNTGDTNAVVHLMCRAIEKIQSDMEKTVNAAMGGKSLSGSTLTPTDTPALKPLSDRIDRLAISVGEIRRALQKLKRVADTESDTFPKGWEGVVGRFANGKLGTTSLELERLLKMIGKLHAELAESSPVIFSESQTRMLFEVGEMLEKWDVANG